MQLLTKLPIKAKYAIIFCSGAAVGGLATWMSLKRKYEELADKEIAEAREHYANKIREKYGEEKPVEKVVEEKHSVIDRTDYISERGRDVESIDYTVYYDNRKRIDPAEMESPVEGDSEEEEHLRYRDGARISSQLNEDSGIEIITPESFAVDYRQHEKETLFFWADDEVVSDENDELVDNLDRVVGNAIETSGLKYDDTAKSVIYIRNFDLGTDYEIQKVAGSYKESHID